MSNEKLELKNKLYKELELKIALQVEGVKFDPSIFKEALKNDKNLVQSHNCMDFSLDNTENYEVPSGIRLENGFIVGLNKNSRSHYYIKREEEAFYLLKEGEKLSKLSFPITPKFYSQKTFDGVLMKTIAMASGDFRNGDRQMVIAYSNECALKDKGLDCLFCNINATKDRFGEKEGVTWKYPKQIAETVKAAYDEGLDHVTITGGFIPERREVDYYLDTAESIQEALGRQDFNGTACIGAPADLAVIEKYKEAGFSTIAFNMEVWNKRFFDAICPGKSEACGGGHEHWVEAIKHAVDVFGFGNVRSNFVAGLEPKEYLLEGIDYLSSLGVVATALSWVPNIGSKFEGHRTPTAEWHWDVVQKVTNTLRRNGITYEQLYNATPGTFIIHDLYRVEDGLLPVFKEKLA